MGEVFDLLAVRADETSVRIVIELVESSVGLRMASHGGSEIRFEGDDLFECLINARLELESRGLLLCCQGCRPDVFPSGMLRQMNGGRFAYQLHRNAPLSEADIVDIFAQAEPNAVASVSGQRAAVMEFFGFDKRSAPPV
jgi:hypothetical protein